MYTVCVSGEPIRKFSRRRDKEGGRFGVSLVVATLIFAGAAAAVSAAVANSRAIARKHDTDVDFAPKKEAKKEVKKKEPPKPKVKVKRIERQDVKAADRANMNSVSEIPDELPDESDAELVAAENTGPVDGMTDGAGMDLTISPPTRDTPENPRYLSGCDEPEVPEALLTSAQTIEVQVRFTVDASGNVKNPVMLDNTDASAGASAKAGSGLIDRENILACVRARRYRPATLSGGIPIAFPQTLKFKFKPSNI